MAALDPDGTAHSFRGIVQRVWKQSIHWEIKLPSCVVYRQAGIKLLTWAKSMRKRSDILNVYLVVKSKDGFCTNFGRHVGTRKDSPIWLSEPLAPLPTKNDAVDVCLHVHAVTLQGALAVLHLFMHGGVETFRPLKLQHYFSFEALNWLQNKVINRQLASWEAFALHPVNVRCGYISYKETFSRHHLAGALAVKSIFAENRCKSEAAMKITLSFLPLRYVDVVAEASSFLAHILPPCAIIKNWRYLSFHRQFNSQPLDQVQACVNKKVIEVFPQLQQAVESKLEVTCTLSSLYGDSLIVYGTECACKEAYGFLGRALEDLILGSNSSNSWNFCRAFNYSSYSELLSLQLENLHFTQCAAYDTFSDRKSVMKLVQDIFDRTDTYDVPLIRVSTYAGKFWSLDNRRLLAYKLCCLSEVLVSVVEPRREFWDKYKNGKRFHHLTDGGRRIGVVQRNTAIALPRSPVIVPQLSKVVHFMDAEAQACYNSKVNRLTVENLSIQRFATMASAEASTDMEELLETDFGMVEDDDMEDILQHDNFHLRRQDNGRRLSQRCNFHGLTLLHLAAARNALNAGQALLDRLADINARSNVGETPLHMAARLEQREFCMLLLAYGANPSVTDVLNRTAAQVSNDSAVAKICHGAVEDDCQGSFDHTEVLGGAPERVETNSVTSRERAALHVESSLLAQNSELQATHETSHPELRLMAQPMSPEESTWLSADHDASNGASRGFDLMERPTRIDPDQTVAMRIAPAEAGSAGGVGRNDSMEHPTWIDSDEAGEETIWLGLDAGSIGTSWKEQPTQIHPDEAAAIVAVQEADLIQLLTQSSEAAGDEEMAGMSEGWRQTRPGVGQDDTSSMSAAASTLSASLPSTGLRTTPAGFNSPHCLLPGTRVQMCSGLFVDVNELEVGDALFSGCAQAIVCAVRRFPKRDRDIAQIRFACTNHVETDELLVTTDHALAAFMPGGRQIQPVLASEIQVGDRLRSHTTQAIVQSVSIFTWSTDVTEIELRDMSSTMFISMGSTAIEVYGATMPQVDGGLVKILSFNRFDNFRESLLENEELHACHRGLERKGFTSDLSVYEIGPAKMLVRADLAEKVLQALAGQRLKCTDVVVSREYEPIVKLAARHGARRTVFVQAERALELPHLHSLRERRSFLDMAASSSNERSLVPCSTTDADKRKGKNPRKVAA